MTCVRSNTGYKFCLIGVLGAMGLSILKASHARAGGSGPPHIAT
jgi:hypothetical protein